MGEPFIGLTGADGARESRPEPGVSSDMHAARPASICGSNNFNRPSASSSPGSVAKLFIIVAQQVNKQKEPAIRRKSDRTCFARSAAPGSHRGTCRTLPPRPERGAYRLRRQHGQRLGHLLPPHGTRRVVAACMRRRHLQVRARASTACAHNATTAERTLIANRRAPPRVVV
jgi:hypothetical protein